MTTFADALAEFEQAWADPRHTAAALPDVDVNRVLAERYTAEPAIVVTRDQVWDMEVRKAWDPVRYIPYVVSEGTSWGRTELSDGSRRHLRSSVQEAWTDETQGRVFEEVVTDPVQRRILFLGRARMEAADGTLLQTDEFQPLFHVEHAVGGTQDAPTNMWRIVSLTDAPDPALRAFFDDMAAAGWLPGFLEIYLEQDLGVILHRR
ncbi:MAG: hypothetical protein EKK42_04325 [Pseudonocardiaceae bacterium]|nr:MAG: hypothetical protein EKK42_04325 [Pseudonocardiaceae bacterium]